MKADLGGTELLEPLKWLEQHAPTQGQSRQIFLLTDGVKWNFSTAVVETIPNQLLPVYAKDCLIVYGLLDDKSISFDHNSSVELEVDQPQPSVARISRIPSISENGMITRLAAKALILELQHAKLPAKRTTVGSRQYRN
ncbi:unnamed protein product [Rotaria sordida]|uniref:Uncharacterized protein n=1 Tax=Rotaria sordida TaxID=392033 RepID=A0A814SIN5_9BILA|nr:unnamed protein product [Rotaria sordida]